MQVKQISTAQKIVDLMFGEIESGESKNGYGERASEYYAFLEDEAGERIAVQLTEETVGLPPEEYFYSLHLVDNITGKNCELFSADEFTKKSVKSLVESLIAGCMSDIATLQAV